MFSRALFGSVTVLAGLLFTTSAIAHVSVSGPGFAGENQVLTFNIGHGCEGADSFRLEVKIPAEVVSARGLPGDFGEPAVVANATGQVTSVTWEKATVKDNDDQFYRHAIRLRVPDAPFTTLYFPAIQTCRTAEGVETVVEWTALPGEEGEAAAALTIMPPRKPGWNRYTTPAAIDDLSIFDDAQIVWAGEAAYSSNEAIMELIEAEPDVEVLTSIASGAEIWVKY